MRWLLAAILALLVLAPAASATFPGRNGELVFTSDNTDRYGKGESSLQTIDGPGWHGYRQLSLCADPEWGSCYDRWDPYLRSPRYSADGAVLAVAAEARPYDPYRPQSSGFGLISADGTSVDYHRGDIVASLAWSPAGTKLLAETLEGLWLMRADGDYPRLLVHGGRAPDWSSRERIVYELGNDLWIRSPKGKRRRLTGRGGAEPSWSPGGRWIAFERRGDVYVVKRGGKGLRRVTRRGGEKPVWSPDGRRIAFVRRHGLYTVRADARNVRELVPGHDPDPISAADNRVTDVDWRPLP